MTRTGRGGDAGSGINEVTASPLSLRAPIRPPPPRGGNKRINKAQPHHCGNYYFQLLQCRRERPPRSSDQSPT